LENGSFSSDEFAKWTEGVVPFLHVTTRIEGRANDDLLGVYGGRGFPTLKFLNAEGKALGEPQGRDIASFDAVITKIKNLDELRERIKKGEKGLDAKLLLAELKMGAVDFADAKKRFASIKKIKPEVKAEIETAIIGLEFNEIMSSMTEENYKELGAKVAEMARTGRIPGGYDKDMFWQVVAGWADENGDLPLLKKGYKYLNEKYGSNERAKQFLDNMKTRIAELEKGDDPDA